MPYLIVKGAAEFLDFAKNGLPPGSGLRRGRTRNINFDRCFSHCLSTDDLSDRDAHGARLDRGLGYGFTVQ